MMIDADEIATNMATSPHQDRRTRICVWIILGGLANFILYIVLYAYFNGEAVNGEVVQVGGQMHYFLQSKTEVSRGAFIYSGIHSISIWVTVGAVMLAMLTLAKERIASSMRSTIVRGRTLITVLATVITLTVLFVTVVFTLRFIDKFNHPITGPLSSAAG